MSGFSRIPDTSELSIRTLNDQLQGLWNKVLGNIGQQDLTLQLQEQLAKGGGDALPGGGVECLNGRPLYDGSAVRLYVSPTGSDTNDGLSAAKAFASIKRAWASVPIYCEQDAQIVLAAGTYYEFVELYGPFYGNLRIYTTNATLHGNIAIRGCTGKISIEKLKIAALEKGALRLDAPGGLLAVTSCDIDCCAISSCAAVDVAQGSALVGYTNVYNSSWATLAVNNLGRLHTNSCGGYNNTGYGINAENGAIVSGIGTVPANTRGNRLLTGARCLDELTTGTVAAQVIGTGCKIARFAATAASGSEGVAFAEGALAQGQQEKQGARGAFWFFNATTIANTLSNKTPLAAELKIQRSCTGGKPGKVGIHLYEHALGGATGIAARGMDLGVLRMADLGEVVSIRLPLSTVERLKSGAAKGICAYSDLPDGSDYMEFAGHAAFRAQLIVIYQ
ncbi:hypothetical protein LJC55_00200 [Eubacteriales bacterium OttesenSCG-928-N14]|nr:hypothetical protein [Eubacteriales bacterium OttesenSCG-928-N14]